MTHEDAAAGETIFGLDAATSKVLMASLCGALILIAGTMSGLTLSLFSLDLSMLRIMKRSGAPKEKERATTLLLLLQNPHWLLVTLLLSNAAAVETMPLMFDRLLNPAAAIAISTALVLIFGEILPQAIFVRHAVAIGSAFEWPLRVLMMLTAVISYPVAKLLDCVVGHRSSVFFRRREIRAFIQIQRELADEERVRAESNSDEEGSEGANPVDYSSSDEEENITQMELHTMLGALLLTEQTVGSCMKPLSDIMTINEEETLDANTVNRLFNTGYSRIPVWSGHKEHMVGYLMMKSLLGLIYFKESDAPKVKDVRLFEPLYQIADEPLLQVYSKFQQGTSHMAIVVADSSNEVALGIITLEDVMERIHNVNITDEMDLTAHSPAQLMIRDWYSRKKFNRTYSSEHQSSSTSASKAHRERTNTPLKQTTPLLMPGREGPRSYNSAGLNRTVELESLGSTMRSSARRSKAERRSEQQRGEVAVRVGGTLPTPTVSKPRSK